MRSAVHGCHDHRAGALHVVVEHAVVVAVGLQDLPRVDRPEVLEMQDRARKKLVGGLDVALDELVVFRRRGAGRGDCPDRTDPAAAVRCRCRHPVTPRCSGGDRCRRRRCRAPTCPRRFGCHPRPSHRYPGSLRRRCTRSGRRRRAPARTYRRPRRFRPARRCSENSPRCPRYSSEKR